MTFDPQTGQIDRDVLARVESARRLTEEGLTHYGVGRTEEAVHCWRQALELVPGEPRAVDYLEAAGFPVRAERAPAPVIVLPTHRDWRADVVVLVRARRYDEALALLYRERAQRPGVQEIPASIQGIKAHLCHGFAVQLGGLDRVLVASEASAPRDLEARAVLRLVDGTSSIDDIASASPLGRFRSLRALVALFASDPDRPNVAVPATAPTLELEAQPASAAPKPSFDDNFQTGMRAYIARRFEEAEDAFRRCEAELPGDPRVALNLRRLEERRR